MADYENTRVCVLMTKGEHREVKMLAAQLGTSVSGLLRQLIKQRAEEQRREEEARGD